MLPLAATIMLAASQAAATGFSGNWCGQNDYAIWIGETEAVLGEHSFCRWDAPVADGPSHRGTLFCRTTQERLQDSVEHVNHVALDMDNRGWMTISYFGDDRNQEPYRETLRPCGG